MTGSRSRPQAAGHQASANRHSARASTGRDWRSSSQPPARAWSPPSNGGGPNTGRNRRCWPCGGAGPVERSTSAASAGGGAAGGSASQVAAVGNDWPKAASTAQRRRPCCTACAWTVASRRPRRSVSTWISTRSWTSGRGKCAVTDRGARSAAASSAVIARKIVAITTPPSGAPGPSHAGSTCATKRPDPFRSTAVALSKLLRAVLTVLPPESELTPMGPFLCAWVPPANVP